MLAFRLNNSLLSIKHTCGDFHYKFVFSHFCFVGASYHRIIIITRSTVHSEACCCFPCTSSLHVTQFFAAQGDITYATVASPPNPNTGTLLQGSGSCKNHDSRIINISNSASRRCPFFQPSGKLPPNHRQTHSAVIGKQTNDGLRKEASFSMALSVNCKEPVALNVNFWIMISLSGFLYVSVNSTTSCVVFSRCFF